MGYCCHKISLQNHFPDIYLFNRMCYFNQSLLICCWSIIFDPLLITIDLLVINVGQSLLIFYWPLLICWWSLLVNHCWSLLVSYFWSISMCCWTIIKVFLWLILKHFGALLSTDCSIRVYWSKLCTGVLTDIMDWYDISGQQRNVAIGWNWTNIFHQNKTMHNSLNALFDPSKTP